MASLSVVVIVAAGIALVALGVAVAALGRNRAALSFAAFAFGHGGALTLAAVEGGIEYASFVRLGWVLAPLYLLSAIGVAGLAVTVPGPIPRRLAGAVAFAALCGGAVGVTTLLVFEGFGPEGGALSLVNAIYGVAIIGTGILLPLRFGAEADATAEGAAARRALALLAIGLAFLFAGQGGDLAQAARTGELEVIEAVWTAGFLVPVPLWLRATRGLDARLARNVAIGIPALLLATMLLPASARAGSYAPGAIAGALFLSYAVLRGQIAGLDVKVRFAISKSTVAAVFIAVFFVASEAAQQFFGATLGGAYVGIAAAGLLVFAIAPLQRAAERLAEKAVPVRPEGLPVVVGSAAALYRAQVALAWTDGRVSPNERVMLRGLRKDLGLDAAAADDIEHEVETERMRQGGA